MLQLPLKCQALRMTVAIYPVPQLKHYPSESPQVAHQRLELATFLSRAGKLPDAARQFSLARHVLKLWYGPGYESGLVATADPLAMQT